MDRPDLQSRARLDWGLAFRRALILQLEVGLDQEELQQRPRHLGAPIGVPACPLLQVEVSFSVRQGGQIEAKAVGEVDELIQPVLPDRVFEYERQADWLQGMGIDEPLLDPLLVSPPEAVHDEVGLGRPGEEVVEQGDESVLGHARPGLWHAKCRDNKDCQILDHDVLEETLRFDTLRCVHRV